jgi:cytochrome d ubiquinol oxidase subunit I
VLAPAQLILGDLHGLNTLEHQPAKVAAMEGHWETQAGAPLLLFALPDQEAAANRYEVAIPKLGSLILVHDTEGTVRGLKEWPPEDRPYVPIVFWSFRLMVGLGLLMIALAALSLWLRRGGRMYETPWFLKLCIAMSPAGFIALLAGWVTTEVGRQPWVVYGLLRTVDAVTPVVTTGAVATSLAAFVIVYGIIFPAGTLYMLRLIQAGPDQPGRGEPPLASATPMRPLSGADVLEPAE